MNKNFEVHRWSLEKVDPEINARRFYTVYAFPFVEEGCAIEIRHWGRMGTSGRWEPFRHPFLPNAMDSAKRKVYAEMGKGYKQIAEDVYPYTQVATKVPTPDLLTQEMNKHRRHKNELGLTDSEIDQFVAEAQVILATLQSGSVDIDKINAMQQRFAAMDQQFGRASATMKMINLIAAQTVTAKARS